MKCWKPNCSEESTIFCTCSVTRIYSCTAHYLDHLQFSRKAKHQPEPLHLKSYPGTKQVLCDYLRRRNTELDRFQEKIIGEVSQKIKELKFQLKIAIDEIERLKKENSALIDRIIRVERTSEYDNLGKFLILEPDWAMKKIQNEICRIDIEKIPDYIEYEGDICDCPMKRDEICIFRDNTKMLLRYNLNDQTAKEGEVSIKQNANTCLSICKLPGGNLFCFGGSSYSSTVFMVYPDNSIEYLASLPQSIAYSAAVYYKSNVYVFGGSNINGGLSLTPKKYVIKENKWKSLTKLSVGASYCTGFGYKNKIFFAGNSHSKIHIYDIQIDSYSEIPIALNYSGKALLLNKNTFYVIGANSHIYEFDTYNYYEWKDLGNCASIDSCLVSHIVEFKKCFYFMDNKSCLNKFDLKSVQKKKI